MSALVVLDTEFNFLLVNDAYAKACGKDASFFEGKNHFDLYPSKEAKSIFDEVVRTKQSYEVTGRPFVYPDQPERGPTYWDWSLSPLTNDKGEVEYLALTLVDATERVSANEALRENENRYRFQATQLDRIYQSAPVGLCVLDTELRFTHINQRLAEINELPPEEHIGKTIYEVIPKITDQIAPLLQQVLDTGEPVLNVETTLSVPDAPIAKRLWLSHYWPLIVDGEVVGINVVAEEITERKRLEETRQRLESFRSLAENSTDMIVRLDQELRHIYINPAVEKLTGLTREAYIGRTNRELGMPDHLVKRWDDAFQDVLCTGKARTIEFYFTSGDGAKFLQSRLIPEFSPDGKVETVLAIVRDLTDRKMAEDELREASDKLTWQNRELAEANARLEAANAELQQFTSVVSHDLKAPLRAVHGLSSWIEEDSKENLSPNGKEWMTLLRARVRHMDELINALLEYSRAGGANPELEGVDSGEMVKEIVEGLDVPRGFSISVSSELPRLKTDRVHLRQVFANLIGNAIEHRRKDTGHVWVRGKDASNVYEFAVSDDGPGIPPEHHERIFEIFQRLDLKKGTTGIGLSVVKKVVESKGGHITVGSKPGEGATFRFTWPKEPL